MNEVDVCSHGSHQSWRIQFRCESWLILGSGEHDMCCLPGRVVEMWVVPEVEYRTGQTKNLFVEIPLSDGQEFSGAYRYVPWETCCRARHALSSNSIVSICA